MVKVYHVDLDSKSVRDPQMLRAHQTMTVGEFKQLVEEVFVLLLEHINVYLYQPVVVVVVVVVVYVGEGKKLLCIVVEFIRSLHCDRSVSRIIKLTQQMYLKLYTNNCYSTIIRIYQSYAFQFIYTF